MNSKQYLCILLYVLPTITHAQESSLRPRVQLAQTKTDLDNLLSALSVTNVSQGQQAIRQLQNQVSSLEQQNHKLTKDLEQLHAQHKDLKDCPKKLAQSQTQADTFKKQLCAHRDRLKKLVDRMSKDLL